MPMTFIYSLIGTLIAALGFFIAREFSGRDKAINELRSSIEELAKSNYDLAIATTEIKNWVLEHYVRRTENEHEHDRLDRRIISGIESHANTCPGRAA